jgi:hypothetical protein
MLLLPLLLLLLARAAVTLGLNRSCRWSAKRPE